MSKIKFKVVKRVNPKSAKKEKKFYAQALRRKFDIRTFCKEAAERSSLTTGDSFNTMEQLFDLLPKYLIDNHVVPFGRHRKTAKCLIIKHLAVFVFRFSRKSSDFLLRMYFDPLKSA